MSDSGLLKQALKTILARPENANCADCSAKKPTWASINLGVFLCLNCSGIHRNLGVHISKVRSVDLDTWEKSWVDKMNTTGNVNFNSVYEKYLELRDKPTEYESQTLGPKIRKFINKKYVDKAYFGTIKYESRVKSTWSKQNQKTPISQCKMEANDLIDIESEEPLSKIPDSLDFEESLPSDRNNLSKSSKIDNRRTTDRKDDSYEDKAARVMALFN